MEDYTQAFAHMWAKSRCDAGKSQEYMASALGVSRNTVRNWETGYSCPSQVMGLQWFKALGISPLPYYLNILYPDLYTDIAEEDDDERITNALIQYIKDTSPSMRRKLLFILYGDHGSSPSGVIEMVTAHLNTPLRSRLNVASIIIGNYAVSNKLGQSANRVRPNMELLTRALEEATKAVGDRKTGYGSVEK